MRLIIFTFFMLLTTTCSTAKAKTGLGLGVSSMSTGVSGYHDLGGGTFVQGLLGLGPTALVGDHCWLNPLAKDLQWYYGAGGYVADHHYWHHHEHEDRVAIGARMPLGLLFTPSTAPLQLSAEIAPALNVAPEIFMGLGLGLALRFVLD